MNEGVNMRFKSVTANLFIVVGPFDEPSSTDIAIQTSSIEAYISITKTTITVTYNSTVITTSHLTHIRLLYQHSDIQ